MKALQLLTWSTYGPERFKQIHRAFDDAWAAIKPLVDDNPLAHEAARLALANTILSVAKGDATGSGDAALPPGAGPQAKQGREARLIPAQPFPMPRGRPTPSPCTWGGRGEQRTWRLRPTSCGRWCCSPS
jgi:hypothetical protein